MVMVLRRREDRERLALGLALFFSRPRAVFFLLALPLAGSRKKTAVSRRDEDSASSHEKTMKKRSRDRHSEMQRCC